MTLAPVMTATSVEPILQIREDYDTDLEATACYHCAINHLAAALLLYRRAIQRARLRPVPEILELCPQGDRSMGCTSEITN